MEQIEVFSQSKENIQPLRHGRVVSQLETALEAQDNPIVYQELIKEQQRYEVLIRSYEGGDPLQLWGEYVSWVEQSFPQGNGRDSKYPQILEKCLTLFKDDANYKQDLRYVKLWLKYIELQANPQEVFQLVHSHGIGTQTSLFYRCWAYHFEIAKDFKHADEVYRLGCTYNAQPKEELDTARATLQMLVGQMMLGYEVQTPVPPLMENRTALAKLNLAGNQTTRVGTVVLNKSPGKLRPLQPSNHRPNKQKSPFRIFGDENAVPDMSGAKADIKHVPRKEEVGKENLLKPGPWTGGNRRHRPSNATTHTIPEHTGHTRPSFQIHQDVDDQQWALPKTIETGNALKSLKVEDDFKCATAIFEPLDPKFKPMYCKNKVAISSPARYSNEFAVHKRNIERHTIDFGQSRGEYNYPFTMVELTQALSQAVSMASGPDDIHYEIARPVGIRMLSIFDTFGIVVPKAIPTTPGRVSPWKIGLPQCHFDLAKFSKSTTPPIIYERSFNELLSNCAQGNKLAAKEASLFLDLNGYVRRGVLGNWHEQWVSTPAQNKLQSIRDGVSWWPSSIRKSRREEVVVRRLRIGLDIAASSSNSSLTRVQHSELHTNENMLSVVPFKLEKEDSKRKYTPEGSLDVFDKENRICGFIDQSSIHSQSFTVNTQEAMNAVRDLWTTPKDYWLPNDARPDFRVQTNSPATRNPRQKLYAIEQPAPAQVLNPVTFPIFSDESSACDPQHSARSSVIPGSILKPSVLSHKVGMPKRRTVAANSAVLDKENVPFPIYCDDEEEVEENDDEAEFGKDRHLQQPKTLGELPFVPSPGMTAEEELSLMGTEDKENQSRGKALMQPPKRRLAGILQPAIDIPLNQQPEESVAMVFSEVSNETCNTQAFSFPLKSSTPFTTDLNKSFPVDTSMIDPDNGVAMVFSEVSNETCNTQAFSFPLKSSTPFTTDLNKSFPVDTSMIDPDNGTISLALHPAIPSRPEEKALEKSGPLQPSTGSDNLSVIMENSREFYKSSSSSGSSAVSSTRRTTFLNSQYPGANSLDKVQETSSCSETGHMPTRRKQRQVENVVSHTSIKDTDIQGKRKVPENPLATNQEEELMKGVGNLVMDSSQLDPFDEVLKERLLTSVGFPQNREQSFFILEATLPRLKISSNINLGNECYTLDRILGEGAYAKVYKASNFNNKKEVALKIQSSSCAWEFYICQEIRSRLGDSPQALSFMLIESAYIFTNYSVLMTKVAPYGNLLSVLNTYRTKTELGRFNLEEVNPHLCGGRVENHSGKTTPVHPTEIRTSLFLSSAVWLNNNQRGQCFNHMVAMFLTVEILRIQEHLMKCHIIHGDIKPDNFLVRSLPSLEDNCPFLELIDFGRSIDMDLFLPGTQFTRVVTTESFQCIEMQTKRPWTYQTDLYGLAGTAHCLLFGDYMKVRRRPCGKWNIETAIPRYSCRPTWELFFSTLLNIESCEQLPDLSKLQELFQEVLLQNVSILKKALNTLKSVVTDSKH
uniref:Mitotic checkpoint serine/threonine-protein kinase BUB1 n=1 Tax=Timema bartmani TaxID=61472 RepID=A0A7R9HW29_9NEOP|nr:unnamed protein product [Timema bartmani]